MTASRAVSCMPPSSLPSPGVLTKSLSRSPCQVAERSQSGLSDWTQRLRCGADARKGRRASSERAGTVRALISFHLGAVHRLSLARRDLAFTLVAVLAVSACQGGGVRQPSASPEGIAASPTAAASPTQALGPSPAGSASPPAAATSPGPLAAPTQEASPASPSAPPTAAPALRFIETIAAGAAPRGPANTVGYRFGLGMLWEGPLRDAPVRSSACSGACSWGREDRDGETQIIVFVPESSLPGTHEVALTLPDGRILVAALPLTTATPPPVTQPSPIPTPAVAAPGRYQVTGTVTSKANGAAIAGVQVQAISTTGGAASRTDAAGIFTSSLPAGKYRIQFLPPAGHVQQWWKAAYDYSSATEVVVSASVVGLDVALAPGHTIRGKVTAASTGAAVPGAQVSAGGQRADSMPVGTWSGFADAAGDYFVTVPKDDPQITHYTVSFAVYEPGSRFIAEFWKGATIYRGTATRLTATGDLAGIDAALEQGFFISGRVTSRATGSPLQGVSVIPTVGSVATRAWPGPPGPVADPGPLGASGGTSTDAAGEYRLLVPAGRYLIKFGPLFAPGSAAVRYLEQWWKGAKTQQAATDVVVSASDVAGIDAAMEPP